MTLKLETSLEHNDATLPAMVPVIASVGEPSSCSSSSSGSTTTTTELHRSSLSSSSVPTEIQTRKRVTFGTIQCRRYPMILGDHPDCLGPPLSFDWNHVREDCYDIDRYEAQRNPSRRHGTALILDWMSRKRLLRAYAGCTEDEINTRMEECAKVRKHREQTRKSAQPLSFRSVLSKMTLGLLNGNNVKESFFRDKDRCTHIPRRGTKVSCNRQEVRC